MKKDSWDETGKDNIRTLEEVELFDVSPVTYAAYPQTDVKIRSAFEKAGLDSEQLMEIMETQKATTNEDIEVVEKAICILNSYLPEGTIDIFRHYAEGGEKKLGDQGTPDNEGYVERLNTERWKTVFSK